MAEASLLGRLKQARVQLFMHLDCGADDLSSQLFMVKVSFRLHLLLLRALRGELLLLLENQFEVAWHFHNRQMT